MKPRSDISTCSLGILDDIPNKQDTDFRIVLQNVNSLPTPTSIEFTILMSQLYEQKVNFFQITEINLPLETNKIITQYKKTGSNPMANISFEFHSSTNHQSNSWERRHCNNGTREYLWKYKNMHFRPLFAMANKFLLSKECKSTLSSNRILSL